MRYNKASDPLSHLLLNTEINNRQAIWLWLGLFVYEEFDFDQDTCNGATMREVIADALREAPDIASDISRKKDKYLLPEEQIKWITNHPRQIQWLTAKIDATAHKVLPRGLPRLQGRERIIATLDIWQVELYKKQREVKNLNELWRRHIANDSQLDWFNDKKEGTKRCLCAWEWIQKKYLSPLSMQLPIGDYQELLMFFDKEDFKPLERTAIIKSIKNLWYKKQFNERASEKKQVNILLSKATISQLDLLASKHDLKRAQIIENLIKEEASAGLYLA
ncbi:hypothetical protein [Pseudomonas oryzihabitans]|uniref:hypothetical protein n=1 Tax=Pseudomonas oryzihabitans TaxID=47885 RepID=UPI00123A6212|nr:hypothetical protein [Pseudomonas oryzihabitans]QEU05027.1 hypothetical protein FOB65_17515 [Pseudomonas oryzihabitans]